MKTSRMLFPYLSAVTESSRIKILSNKSLTKLTLLAQSAATVAREIIGVRLPFDVR
jgi:hypothetical protein